MKIRMTLDSGNRQQWNTGAKRDTEEGKQTAKAMGIDHWNIFMKGLNQPALDIDTEPFPNVQEDVNVHVEPVTRIIDGVEVVTGFEVFTVRLDITGEPVGREYTECLIDPLMLNRLQALLVRGAEKYDKWNWRKGIPTIRFFTSALRHLLQWRWGDRREDHLAAVVFNSMGAMRIEKDVDTGVLDFDMVEEAGTLAYIP